MEINILKLSFTLDSILKRNAAEKIRGYFGNLFWDSPYAHQHNEEGSLIYQYPCVQYKVVKGSCVIIGFNEGCELIKHAFFNLKTIKIDDNVEDIISKGLESYKAILSITDRAVNYSFLTPWLSLNERNYKKYQQIGNCTKRKKLLEKIIVGNIISISKSLGYTVPASIESQIIKLNEVQTSLKGTPMLGFLGTFSVNFEIPDYWGIGKSVSRGFGTVKRIYDKNRKNNNQ